MWAMATQKSWCASSVAEYDVILAQHAHGNGNVFQVDLQTNRMPVAPQHLTRARARPRARQFVEQLLVRTPLDRITIDPALRHFAPSRLAFPPKENL
jgi:hypothetical protein